MLEAAARDNLRIKGENTGKLAEKSSLGDLEELNAKYMKWEPRLGMTVGQAEAEAAGVVVGDTLVRIVPLSGGKTGFEDEVINGGIWHAVSAHN